MLIPISHESSTVRRHPWVTYGLILACLAIFLHTNSRERETRLESERLLSEALEYYFEHPYLEPDSRLATYMTGPQAEQLNDMILTIQQAEEDLPFLLPSEVEARQAELDDRFELAFAKIAEHPFRRWGLVAAHPSARGALGHMFVHGGWLHLLGNLFLLFLTGTFIEDVWGRPLYAGFYLLAGLAGAGLFIARFPETTLPLVGASGAIAGCMGAFLIRYWNTRIHFFFWFVIAGTFAAPAWLMLPLWFGHEYAMAQMSEQFMAGGGVAYWAHVGGFAFGVAAALCIRVLKIEERFVQPAVEKKITLVSNERVESALQAQSEGRSTDAFEILTRELRRDPRNREAALALWDVASAANRHREAAPSLLRVIRDDVRTGQGELAIRHWIELTQNGGEIEVEVPLLLRLLPMLMEAGEPAAARDAMERILSTPKLSATVSLRVARIARNLDGALAVRAARGALESGDLAPPERADAEAILAELGEVLCVGEPAADPATVRAAPPPDDELLAPAATPIDLSFDDDPSIAGDALLGCDGAAANDGVAAEPEELLAAAGSLPDLASTLDPADFDAENLGDAEPLLESPPTAAELGIEYGNIDLGGDTEDVALPALRRLSVVSALPLEFADDVLSLDVEGRGKVSLPLRRVRAIAVAAIAGLGARPVLVVDLVLNWVTLDEEPLKIFRLRSDRFDPRTLVSGIDKPLPALRVLIGRMAESSQATLLPDRESARGEPRFASFAAIESYQREVLLAEEG